MKRYVLGNYELSSYEILLLSDSIKSHLSINQKFINDCSNLSVYNELWNKENKILSLLLKELERYWD